MYLAFGCWLPKAGRHPKPGQLPKGVSPKFNFSEWTLFVASDSHYYKHGIPNWAEILCFLCKNMRNGLPSPKKYFNTLLEAQALVERNLRKITKSQLKFDITLNTAGKKERKK